MEINLFTNTRGFECLITIISLGIYSIFLIAMGGKSPGESSKLERIYFG